MRRALAALLGSVVVGALLIPAAAAHDRHHTVRAGESLSHIALRYGTSTEALARANGLPDPDHVEAGERLKIPGAGGTTTTTHTVRPGETLSEIAARYGTSVDDLTSHNGIGNPDHVRIGRTLHVPGGGGGGGGGTVHTVRRGETLSEIAVRYGVSTEALRLSNNLASPHVVWAGSKLVIPGGSSPGMAPASHRSAPGVDVPSSRAHLRSHFERYAAEAGVDPRLTMALAWQESGWQSGLTSSAGAAGVMQLMPATVDFASRVLLGVAPLDPYDPVQNIRMGSHHFAYLLRQTDGDKTLALAAWYQGLRSVRERGPFDSSRRFAANVLALRTRF